MVREGKSSRPRRVALLVAAIFAASCGDPAGDPALSTNDAGDADAGGTDGTGFSDAPPVCHGAGSRFVTDVVSYQFGDGQDFGRAEFPGNVLGPPKGGGCC